MSQMCLAQSPGGVENYKIWKPDFSARNNANIYDEKAFNFNEYMEVPVFDFSENYGFSEFKRFTFFMVYSNEGAEHIAVLNTGENVVQIKSDRVEGNSIIHFKDEPNRSNIFMFKGAGKKDKLAKEITSGITIGGGEVRNQDAKICVSEILVYDRILQDEEIDRIESYLSIKYGISLPIGSSHYDSNGDVILDSIEVVSHTLRVTGIGSDQESGLHTLQSRNSLEANFLQIGIEKIVSINNRRSKSGLKDKNFMFWSDNGADLLFEEHKKYRSHSILARSWKINTRGADIRKKLFKVNIGKELIENFDSNRETYLVINNEDKFNDIENLKSFRLSNLGDLLSSDKVDFFNDMKGELYFTLIQKDIRSIANSGIEILHPNPIIASAKFSIDIKSNTKLSGTVYLTDINGEIINEYKCDDNLCDFSIEERLHTPGTYIVSYNDGEGNVKSSKIIIQ